MAKTIDDLILEISDLINVLNNKNGGSGGPGYNGGSPAANSGSADDIFKALNNTLINYKNRIDSLSKTHKNYEETLNNGELKNKIDEFINEINIINSELPKGVTKLENSNSFIEGYIKEKDKQNNIIADINSKKFNLSVLENKLTTEKLEQDRLEIDARKKTIQSEIEIEESKTKARQELLKEEIKILTERNKFLAKPKVSLYAENKKQSAKIKEMAEARGVSWGTNKKGKETSFSELWKGLSNILSAPRIALKTQSVGRLAAKGVAGGAKIAANAAKTIQGGKMDVSGMMSGLSDGLSKMGPYGQAAGALVDILKVCFEEFSKVDKAASDYARSVGGGHAAQVKMRSSAADLAAEMSNLGQRAYEADKILERMVSASEAMGRNLEYLSTADIRSLQDLKDFGIGDDVISQFETFGVSVHNVSKQIADLYGESGKRGLNAKATIKAFTSNLKMAQNYTFARGQKALMDMAMKSAQLKFNLRDAEQFANKVSTLEGAMTAGAQLSVLGGSFAMQGNPLAMMYNGLNDVEGLQNQMLAMTKGMARWDSLKGQLDITAFDRERLKAMSQATGIDYTELTTQAMNQARVDRVTQQLGGGFSKEQEEYIKNIASLDENGRAYVQMDNEKFTIEQLKNRPDLLSRLEDESKKKDIEKGSDLGKILNDTRNIQDKIDDFIKFFKSQFTKYIVSIAAKVTGRDENALMYGLEGQSLKDYNATKKLLDDKNLSTKKIQKAIDNGELSQDAIERLRSEGIINQNNEYIGRRGDSRYDNGKSYAWSETAKLWAPGKTQNKAKGGFVSGEGGPTEDAIPARLSNGEFVVNSDATTRHRPLLERINNETNNSSKSTVGFNKGGYINTDSKSIGVTIPTHLSNSEFTVNSNAITRHMLLLERINHKIEDIVNLIRTKTKFGFNEGKFRNSSRLRGDVIREVNNSGYLMRPESTIGFNEGRFGSGSRLTRDVTPATTRLSNARSEVITRYRPLSERINRNVNYSGDLMRPESIIGFNEGRFRSSSRLRGDTTPSRLSKNEFAVNVEDIVRYRPFSERINRNINLMRPESIIGFNEGKFRSSGRLTRDITPATTRLSNVGSDVITRRRPSLERINRNINNGGDLMRPELTIGFNEGRFGSSRLTRDVTPATTRLPNVGSEVMTRHRPLSERINRNVYNSGAESTIGFNEGRFTSSSRLRDVTSATTRLPNVGSEVITRHRPLSERINRNVDNSGAESTIGFNEGRFGSTRLTRDITPATTRLSNVRYEVITRHRPLSEHINRNVDNGDVESTIGFNEGKFRSSSRLRNVTPVTTRLPKNEFAVNVEDTTRYRPLSEHINRGVKNGDNLMRHESIMGLNRGEDRISSAGNQKIDVSPIKIEFGTLELKIGDLTRVLDSNEVASKLLNNSAFVDNIVKEIGIRANFGYRKEDSSNKFLDTPFMRSF